MKTLDETLETCRARGLRPEEPYIRESAMLLDGYLIDPIYRYMADIDRRIRDKGDPKSVGRKDVTDEITEMVKFLDKCKDEVIRGIKQAEPEQNTKPAKRWRKISNFFWKLYEKTLKVIVDAVLEKFWPK
ncbi:MAG: hypothetical protein JW837_03055 [Sedimentisphaerales bacterium]|nr:hypothetical protein [Sedimentisphaerales bacterium]